MTLSELLMLFAVVLALIGNGIYLATISKQLEKIADAMKGDKRERV